MIENKIYEKDVSLIGKALIIGGTKNLLKDVQDIVSPFMNNHGSIDLGTIIKLEELLGVELISIPTDKEWVIINRRKKLEHLKNINDEN